MKNKASACPRLSLDHVLLTSFARLIIPSCSFTSCVRQVRTQFGQVRLIQVPMPTLLALCSLASSVSFCSESNTLLSCSWSN